MAEVNLHSWSEISQASEGLQLNSTTATWENILARVARIESRLLEHERRAASTLPPLRPEPDPPDGPLLYAAAQPQFQFSAQFQFSTSTSDPTSISLLHQTDQSSPPTPEPAPPYSGSALPTSYSATGYHSRLLEYQPPLVKNQPAHDAQDARHSVGCQQHQYSNLNIDGQPPYPSYQSDEYGHWANEQLPVHQQLPSKGFDSRRVGEISTPRVPEPPPHPAIDPLYDLRPWETLGQRALHEYSLYDQPPQHPPTCWEIPGQRAFHEYSPYDQSSCPPCRWDPPAQRATYGYLPHHVQQPQLDPAPPYGAPSYELPTWDYRVQQQYQACDQLQYTQWQDYYNHTQMEIPSAYPPSWRPESISYDLAPVQSVSVTKFEGEEGIYSFVYGSKHRMREQEGATSDSLILNAKIEYSCDDAKDFDYVLDRGMMEEGNCAEPENAPSTDSIFETGAKEDLERDIATSDTGDVSSPTIGLTSDADDIGESRDNRPGFIFLKDRNFPKSDRDQSEHQDRSTKDALNNTKPPSTSSQSTSKEIPKSNFGPRASDSAGLMKFTEELSGSSVILEKLRELSWSGVPPDLCPTVWRLFLGYASSNSNGSDGVLRRMSMEYLEHVAQYYEIADILCRYEEMDMLSSIAFDSIAEMKEERDSSIEESIEEVKRVIAAFNAARVTSQDVVENCWDKRKGAYAGFHVITMTSLDTDARLIPPRITDTPCLVISARFDKHSILVLNYHEPKGPSLVIFYGDDEGRCSSIWRVFDPGGDTSPRFSLSTLFVASWFPP